MELFYDAGQDGPWLKYPESTGHPLVHVGKQAALQPWERGDARALIAELLKLDLSHELKSELQELDTRLGSQI